MISAEQVETFAALLADDEITDEDRLELLAKLTPAFH
jgi:hypothetical protein